LDGQTALKEHFAVLHYETASTTQQPLGEHRGTIKDCKIAGATTWQGRGIHTFTTHMLNISLRKNAEIHLHTAGALQKCSQALEICSGAGFEEVMPRRQKNTL